MSAMTGSGSSGLMLRCASLSMPSKRAELLALTDRILDENPIRMAKAIEANFTVWPFYYQYSNEANMPASTFEGEIARIRELTVQRAQLLDRLFAE